MKEVILETKKVIAKITRSMKDWKKIKEITQKQSKDKKDGQYENKEVK